MKIILNANSESFSCHSRKAVSEKHAVIKTLHGKNIDLIAKHSLELFLDPDKCLEPYLILV